MQLPVLLPGPNLLGHPLGHAGTVFVLVHLALAEQPPTSPYDLVRGIWQRRLLSF